MSLAVSMLHAVAPQLDATAIADALWLATRMSETSSESLDSGSKLQPPATTPAFATLAADRPRAEAQAPSATPKSRALHERLPGSDSQVRGHAVGVPRAAALPLALEVTRALRPWKQPWYMGRCHALDLDATVDSYARSGELIPVFTAAPERWFDLVLVVDRSPSMQVWQETIDAFVNVLDRLGAFRTLQVRDLTFTAGSGIELHDRQGRSTAAGQVCSPNGRRLVVTVSDCAARAWRAPTIWQQLREWSQTTPVALLNPLPTKVWRRTGLDLPTVRVASGPPGADNSKFTFERPSLLPNEGEADGRWLPIPVLSLSPHSLDRWSRTVMRGAPDGCAAVLVPPSGRNVSHGRSRPSSSRGPEARAEGFLRTSAPAAARLAVLCSPFDRLSLGLLHLIRQELVPEATTADIAEVLTAGVFTLDTDAGGAVELVVAQKIQARLRQDLAEHEVWRLHRVLSRYVSSPGNSQGRLPVVAQGVHGPDEIPAEAKPFGHASLPTLELLGLSSSGADETQSHDSPAPDRPELKEPNRSAEALDARITTIRPGQITTRAEMMQLFGGGPQGGIVPSVTTPNILIYTDHEAGHRYGYYDGWLAETDEQGAVFEYTGAGTVGDQTFTGRKGSGNKAILQHVEAGRTLRVFIANGKVPGSGAKYQRYVGEFTLDPDQPYVMRQAPDDNGDLRNVIVFRLRPSGDVEHDAKDDIPPAEETKTTLVSADVATNAVVESEDNLETDGTRSVQAKTETERREAVLLRRFRAYLQRRGHVLKRHQIKIKGEASTLQTDLYDVTDHVLYEAKGNTSREAVRMAVGQLHDFRRHVEPPNPRVAVLLPSEPSDKDLKDYLSDAGIALVYLDGDTFIGDILPE